jgi:hypothetical protein
VLGFVLDFLIRKYRQNGLKKESTFVAKLGTNWNDGANTGAFNWNLNNSSGNRNHNISTQLYTLDKNKHDTFCLASWQNID